MRKLRLIIPLVLFLSTTSLGQLAVTPAARWTTQAWDARWITAEGGPTDGLFHFRKTFPLAEKPHQFVIHISADTRYRLLINGKYVTEGPQLSDLRHWRFESLNVADLLQAGQNVIAVQVWNLGDEAPLNQMGKRLALIVQGDDPLAAVVNTDKSWKIIQNMGSTPLHFGPGDPNLFYQYYAAGPLEKIDGKEIPWGWEQLSFNDSNWKTAVTLQAGSPFQTSAYGDSQWELIPRSIPLMERTYQPFATVRRAEGLKLSAIGLSGPITVPAKQKVSLLIDQGKLTTAFPELITSKGAGREIKVTYAEAMFNDMKNKGHRDSISGKSIHGIYDLFVPDGGEKRIFSTLSYRTFRFVQIDISAGDEPLIIEKIGSWFTGYPFEKVGVFSANDPTLEKIFDVGWHTARLCAYDTYMDCPYWERLQYIGDTRIQAMVSYYASGDDRLARNAIEQFEWSLQYDGLTYSRYPSSLPQYIPNYSLVWVLMVNDFMMYRNDPGFVKSFLPGIKRVLEHFKQYVTPDKMVGSQPYWDFIDHSFNTKKVLDGSFAKRLTTNSLFYAYTLSRAAEIFSYFDQNDQAQEYIQLSQQLKESVRRQCWDANSQLYADTPDEKSFSSHSNILAVLCGLMPREEQVDLLRRIVDNKGITQTTLYFDFYLGRAMNQAWAGDLYFDLLSKWKDLLKLGVTTFPEGVSRSECHAWSASPNFEMLATFAGIQPQVPGFKKVLVRPLLQKLDKVSGSMAHWAGTVDVKLEKKGKLLTGTIILPPGITGRLEWEQKVIELKSGENKIEVD